MLFKSNNLDFEFSMEKNHIQIKLDIVCIFVEYACKASNYALKSQNKKCRADNIYHKGQSQVVKLLYIRRLQLESYHPYNQ